MRVRDHIALSTTAAALLAPRLGRRVLAPWAASIAIDLDHYLWFCLRHRRLNPLAAIRIFNQSEPPQHVATRFLHQPLVLLAMALFSARRRGPRAAIIGMASHVALDVYNERRVGHVRRAALERDDYTCQGCARRGPRLGTHVWRQPRLLPSYDVHNHVTLCAPCHDAAHALRSKPVIGHARRLVPRVSR
jgi:hypothetical protein